MKLKRSSSLGRITNIPHNSDDKNTKCDYVGSPKSQINISNNFRNTLEFNL